MDGYYLSEVENIVFLQSWKKKSYLLFFPRSASFKMKQVSIEGRTVGDGEEEQWETGRKEGK